MLVGARCCCKPLLPTPTLAPRLLPTWWPLLPRLLPRHFGPQQTPPLQKLSMYAPF
jgi:hypothetical protein